MTELTRRRLALVLAVGFGLLVLAIVVFRPGDQASAGVDLADPSAWVEHGIDGELLQINGVTGDVTARVTVAEAGESIVAVPHAEGAVVLNRTAGTVSLINGSTLAVTTEVAVEFADSEIASSARIFGVPNSAKNAIVVSDRQILSIDLRSKVVTLVSTLSAPVHHPVQSANGDFYALRADSRVVQRLGNNGLDDVLVLNAPVAGTADERALVRAGGSIWVIDPARLSLSELLPDETLGAPVCMTSAAAGATFGGNAASERPIILAHNPQAAILSITDTTAESCVDIEVDVEGENFGEPVSSKGIAYLPNWGANRIEVVDISAGELISSLPFGTGGNPFELEVVGSMVWANEPLGPFAAVVSEFGLFPVAKLGTIVAGSVEVDGDGDGDTLAAAEIDGGGLRVLGDSGDEVIASDAASTGGDGAGTGDGTPENGQLDTFEPDVADNQPSGVGISVQGPEQPQNQLTPDLSTTLIANFGVSSARAKVGEVLRFTDFSSGSPTTWTWDFGDGTGAREPNVEKSFGTAGIYVVRLSITNTQGAESSLSTEVTIVPDTVLLPPTADFAFDRNTIEAGESVTFESKTTGEADLLEWDFGDGAVARGSSLSHTYAEPGTYTVTLTASNPAGATTASTEITVLQGVEAPLAAIDQLPGTIVEGQFVRLESASLNEPTRLSWDLGDGTRASGASFRHAWATPGTYRVRLTAENSAGTDSVFVDVVVSKRVDPPVSQFTQSATKVLVGATVSFTDLSLNEPTRLVWDFGDGTTARGSSAQKSWSQSGTYRVTLRAVNEAGANRSGVTITVVEPVDPPVASFRVDTATVAPGQPVVFIDTSSNTPTTWAWTFGDGDNSNGPNPTHTFAAEGTYTVRLTVSNEGGSSTTERQITVKDRPSANFRWETDGRKVSFTDTSWDDPREWFWDFGDGTTSKKRSPDHSFETGGSYDVTLVVSNDAGSSAPKTQAVRVGDPPVANFSCDAQGSTVVCDAGASRNAVSYQWRSPDAATNSTPNQEQTTFTYASNGRFDVTLVVTNDAGETDSETKRSPRVTAGRAPRIRDVAVAERSGDLVRLEAKFDREPTSWQWSVEGAELVEGGNTPTPLFRVPQNGRYDGVVRATNDFGTDSDEFRFTTNAVSTEAAFEWTVVSSGTVQFTNTSVAHPEAKFEWRFPGSIDVLDPNIDGPRVRYPTDGGSYRVVLLVSDVNGADSLRRTIDIPRDEAARR